MDAAACLLVPNALLDRTVLFIHYLLLRTLFPANHPTMLNTNIITQRKKANLCVDVDHGGQQEGEGLSGARGGDADHVSAQQRHRPALTLDRRSCTPKTEEKALGTD